MRISILINNFNYGRFLGEAIDSALAQTHPDVEVVVCDDGSTDDSWDVIRRYGPRIRAWRSRENFGQASAMNAGMALCTGDWVLFLDADDWLAPDAMQACAPLMRPDVAKVQFPLRCIDRKGRCMGRQIPYLMHDGDVRPVIRRFGSYAGPPSSGNLYRRAAIARCFPLDMPTWRRAADTPPFIVSAFHGRVASCERALGAYRIHSAANRARGCFGNIATRHADTLRVDAMRRREALALLARVDGPRIEGPFLQPPWNLRTRALSWRTERAHHPYADDGFLPLLRLQARSLAACPGYTWLERRAAQVWLAAFLLMPARWAERLAVTNTSGRLRRWMRPLRGPTPSPVAQGTAS
ncbi:MAG: hypothetical protein RL456_3085 [Pseudomonadota bacterium]|jgi:hypothetical protein